MSTFTFSTPIQLTKGEEYLVSFGTWSDKRGRSGDEYWGSASTTPANPHYTPPFITLWGRELTSIETSGVANRTGWIGAGATTLAKNQHKSYRTKLRGFQTPTLDAIKGIFYSEAATEVETTDDIWWFSLVGPQSAAGETIGPKGGTGDKGQKGETGSTGQKGQGGTNGINGSKGQKGQTGAFGSNGSKGQKGEIGVTGTNGSKGQKGQSGTNGTKGQKGEIGVTGAKGSTGIEGEKGDSGSKG